MRNALLLCSLAASVFAAQTTGTRKSADNTKVNQRDRSAGALTADQQKENQGDRDLAVSIRKTLMENKHLSTYAHNVKVIARNGIVTLKGPVRSQEEKLAVETSAKDVAGAGKVRSMLSIKPAL